LAARALLPSLLVFLVFLVSLPACSKGCGGSAAAERTQVTVSIFPVYDLVRRVAGPDADVHLVVPPGKTEHGFQPTARDGEIAARSKLAVMVGLGLDSWMEDLMRSAPAKARTLKVGDRVPTLPVEEGKDDLDPHVWMDPQRGQLIVRAIAEELGRVDAAHAIAYRERATELDSALAALDQDAERRLKALPRKGFVTLHAGFGYFAERYKLSVLAVLEPVPGKEPTSESKANVLRVTKDKDVPALFGEPQLDQAPVKALAAEAQIPVGVLDPLGGGPDTDSYEKMIRFDVTALEKHLSARKE
jgi:ABC-type Zn uptake system ZnuABC Zn-binding protein ZnuA